MRRAIAAGSVSWSMGEVLARVATPGDEARWVELAASRTVRKVRGLVAAALEEARNGGAKAAVSTMGVGEPSSDAASIELEADAGDVCTAGDEMCTLTCTVGREEAWLFEATRALLDQLGTRGGEEQTEALLAEAQGALLDRLARSTPTPSLQIAGRRPTTRDG
ncbi:MAG TPA: hypothetical protein VNN80_22320, partial [Polyangiaceae bacterium]|nr:hypothetical protein [Polyangiaceae bacterium]